MRPNCALCTWQAETVTVQRTADTVVPHSHPTKVGQAVRLVTTQSTDDSVTVQRTADTVIPHSHPTKVGQAVRLVTLQSTDDSVVHPQELFSG